MIAAIETEYQGYRFRSRLEARWAVFFETLKVRYEYEKEGYDLSGILVPSEAGDRPLPEDTRYLPDFWLPDVYDQENEPGIWLEIKGSEPNGREFDLCEGLSRVTKQSVLMAIGLPLLDGAECLMQIDGGWDMRVFVICSKSKYHPPKICYPGETNYAICPECGSKMSNNDVSLKRAIRAAKRARWEYGERPTIEL